jgi:hypothetical protein
MATCKISEFAAIGQSAGKDIQIPFEPAIAHQSVTYTTATASSAFNDKTRFVKLYPSADCYVRFSTAGSAATTAYEFLKGTTDHWRAVGEGQSFKVSIYDGSS